MCYNKIVINKTRHKGDGDPDILSDLINNWDKRDVKVLREAILRLESNFAPELVQKYYQAMPWVTQVGIPDVLAVDASGQALVATPRGIMVTSLDSVIMNYI